MWCETSGLDGSAEPGPELGIHLGMGGRIVVTAGGRASEGGGPRRLSAGRKTGARPGTTGTPVEKPAAPPESQRTPAQSRVEQVHPRVRRRRQPGAVRQARGWGGDPARTPTPPPLGPDAERVTRAPEFRELHHQGHGRRQGPACSTSPGIAGVGNLLRRRGAVAGQDPARTPVSYGCSPRTPTGSYRALQAALASAIASGGVHTGRRSSGAAPRRHLPALRRGGCVHGTVGGRAPPGGARAEQAPWPAVPAARFRSGPPQ